MPELPEVETIARQLQAGLAGRSFGRVLHVRSDMVHGANRPLGELLPGLRVRCVRRRAKRVIFELSGCAAEMIVHLGMTGRLLICPCEDPVEKHTHLRVAVRDSGLELRFRDPRRFGGIWWSAPSLPGESRTLTRADSSKAKQLEGRRAPAARRTSSGKRGKALGPLGPEPLELSADAFAKLLDRNRQIKALLMDQTAIAGLGNIYCDEALFAAGLHPLSLSCDLPLEQARRLLRAIKSTLRRAIRHQGSTFMDYRSPDGRPGGFQRFHRVYGREDLPCRACGSTIARTQVAGRSTFVCPTCQPKPRPRRSALRRPIPASTLVRP